jgi:hypothetical protein
VLLDFLKNEIVALEDHRLNTCPALGDALAPVGHPDLGTALVAVNSLHDALVLQGQPVSCRQFLEMPLRPDFDVGNDRSRN